VKYVREWWRVAERRDLIPITMMLVLLFIVLVLVIVHFNFNISLYLYFPVFAPVIWHIPIYYICELELGLVQALSNPNDTESRITEAKTAGRILMK